MPGGLIGLIRHSCYNCIKNLNDKFYEPFENDIRRTVLMYLYVFNSGYYSNEFTEVHIEYLKIQFDRLFDKFFSTDRSLINELNKVDNDEMYLYKGTYLHQVCGNSRHGNKFCPDLFYYFLKKGVSPYIKNEEGLLCIDLLEEEDKDKIRYIYEN